MQLFTPPPPHTHTHRLPFGGTSKNSELTINVQFQKALSKSTFIPAFRLLFKCSD